MFQYMNHFSYSCWATEPHVKSALHPLSPKRNDMKNEFQRWWSLGSVFLFMIGCAIILAVITPLAPKELG